MTGILNRVGMLISTTGQGTVTASVLISDRFLTPAEAGAVNGQSYYWLLEDGGDFEIFEGTWTLSGTTISRDTVIKSKIGGTAGTTKLNLSGSATLRSVAPKEAFVDTSTLQPLDATLTALAGVTVAANKLIYANGADSFVTTDLTAAARTVLDDATVAAMLTTLGAVGKQAIYIDATAMTARTTNGAAAATSTESTTNKIMQEGYDFDASTIEYMQFRWRMPKQWDEGTVTFVPVWSHASTSTNFKVSWGLQAVAISDDDALDAAFGTAQYSNDTGGTTRDLYQGPESSAITVAGSPAADDYVVFQVLRKADDGTNDTLAIDATLHGIVLFITNNTGNDA